MMEHLKDLIERVFPDRFRVRLYLWNRDDVNSEGSCNEEKVNFLFQVCVLRLIEVEVYVY